MFAIKTDPGSERRMAKIYTNGFLPSYSPAPTEETKGKKIKKLIVPGYVFVLEKIRGAERVMDEEWRIIEALSDSNISTIDQDGQVVAGPLMGLNEIVAKVEGCRASVHTCLLGKWRWYEIEVLRTISGPADTPYAAAEEEADGGAEGSAPGSAAESKKQEGKKVAEKKTYTDEELKAAVENAKAVGIHAAAKSTGIPWQTILGAARKAGVEIEPKKTNKKAAAEKPTAAKKTPAKKGRKDEELKTEESVPAAATEEKKAKQKATLAEEKNASPLEIENAVLRSENEKLKAQIAKLKKALQELL